MNDLFSEESQLENLEDYIGFIDRRVRSEIDRQIAEHWGTYNSKGDDGPFIFKEAQ